MDIYKISASASLLFSTLVQAALAAVPEVVDNADLNKIENSRPAAQDTISSEAAIDAKFAKVIPRLSIKGEKDFYLLCVDNRAELPAMLFTEAPWLPPAGENAAASRSWVYIKDHTGAPIETMVSISGLSGLSGLKLNRNLYPASVQKIKLDIWDRQNDLHYVSDYIELPKP